jgi:hypothetical protein
MMMNPYAAARIAEDQIADAHERARRSRLERDTRARPEPNRRRFGLAIARVGLRIAGVHAAPARS